MNDINCTEAQNFDIEQVIKPSKSPREEKPIL